MSSQRFRRLEVRSGSLDGGRILSMYNEQTICITCKEKEQQRADYRKAVEADHAEIRKGNYNFQGIAWTTERKRGGRQRPLNRKENTMAKVIEPFC